jgi:hypothetical protein
MNMSQWTPVLSQFCPDLENESGHPMTRNNNSDYSGTMGLPVLISSSKMK